MRGQCYNMHPGRPASAQLVQNPAVMLLLPNCW